MLIDLGSGHFHKSRACLHVPEVAIQLRWLVHLFCTLEGIIMEDRSKAMYIWTMHMFSIWIQAGGLSQRCKERHLRRGLDTPRCWRDPELSSSEAKEARIRPLRTWMRLIRLPWLGIKDQEEPERHQRDSTTLLISSEAPRCMCLVVGMARIIITMCMSWTWR
jgi:hypothetical protein